jgi:hypothetical protein
LIGVYAKNFISWWRCWMRSNRSNNGFVATFRVWTIWSESTR